MRAPSVSFAGACAAAVPLGIAVLYVAAAPCARAATVTILYRFHGADGSDPMGPLIADTQGNLYGTTNAGGAKSHGVIYRLTPPGQAGGAWQETVLHDFAAQRGGVDPIPPLLIDAKGNLYGATFDGGNCYFYCGVAFRLSPGPNQTDPWRYTVLFRFTGQQLGTGGAPIGGLLSDAAGGYFGTTEFGGNVQCSNLPGACGTVYHLTPPAQPKTPWSESLLYTFKGPPDGEQPVGGVVADAQGNLYGAATQGGRGHCTDGEGGVLGCGAVFELAQQNGAWAERLLYQFTPKEFGNPEGPLVFGADGALYGEATYDIFRVMPQTDAKKPWTKQVVFEFKDGIAGTIPNYGLVFDAAGNLYGSTDSSGLSGFSTVFELTPGAAGAVPWTLTTLATFGHDLDSEQPKGGLLLGGDGTLYGVLAASGGGHGNGQVFAITR